MGSNEIAALFINSANPDYAKTAIDDLFKLALSVPISGVRF